MHRIFRSFAVGMMFIIPILSTDLLAATAATKDASWGQLKVQSADYQSMPAGKTFTTDEVGGEWEEVLISRRPEFPAWLHNNNVVLEFFGVYRDDVTDDDQTWLVAKLAILPPSREYREYALEYRHGGDKLYIRTAQVEPMTTNRGDVVLIEFREPYIGTRIQAALTAIGTNDPPGYMRIIGYP